MKPVVAGCVALLAALSTAHGASVSRSYSYFTVGGLTLDQIEADLEKRGPVLGSTGSRHPGATRMEFKTRVGYQASNGRCSVSEANVTVAAEVFLPRWRDRTSAGTETVLIWDTLSADIRRHEEGHIVIARTYAQRLEQALLGVRDAATCEDAATRAESIGRRVLSEHDAEQARYDRVETVNFESRMLRLLEYRLQRLDPAVTPGARAHER